MKVTLIRVLTPVLGLLFTASVAGAQAPAATAAPAAAPAVKKFENDGNHTRIRFVASTIFDVDGWFDKYNVSINAADPDAAKDAAVKLEIDAASINTNNAKRDEHLRSPDFFDVAKFPKITFVSTKVSKKGKDGVTVEGDLTLRGVTKKVKIPFKAMKAKNGYGIEEYIYRGGLKINRKDFALGDGIAAKIALKDEVNVQIELAGFFK